MDDLAKQINKGITATGAVARPERISAEASDAWPRATGVPRPEPGMPASR
jgi:hypothetical protein